MNDVRKRSDIALIVETFYDLALKDPIVGFIFTDVARIDLPSHLPIVTDFWQDVVFAPKRADKRYHGNTLGVHLELAEKIALRPGHFTRWLYLFNRAVDQSYAGVNAQRMKERAESVANSISAALTAGKRGAMNLTLGR